MVTTSAGWLLVLAVLAPFVGVLVGLALGGRHAQRVAWLTVLFCLLIVGDIAYSLLQSGQAVVYLLGGWAPPLGIALRADGLSVVMLVAVAVVIGGIAVYARADFGRVPGEPEKRAPFVFWLLLMAVWGSLNLVFVSGDLFTLYVALELLTFSGVPLVCLDGKGETLRAALRYLLFALAGSLLYLLGAVMLYGGYGTLDIQLLAERVRPEPIAWAAAALMTVGLLAKTALFPLHIWLPPAHAGAPAAASAVLSALVIKGSWFLVVRLWFGVMPGVVTAQAGQLLGALGALAIVVGSLVALRQERLKLLVAYSTMAQIGYLFLMFPLAFDAGGLLVHGAALAGGLLQAVSHATAKAGMFMAAGLVYATLGHDRIKDLAGVARVMPVTVLAFLVSGLALMGVVPSGAYLAKKLLLGAAEDSGQWWWTVVLQGGAVFTAGYVVLVLVSVLRRPAEPLKIVKPVARASEWAALLLALCSLGLAFAGLGPWLPAGLIKNPFVISEMGPTLLVVLGGALLALALAQRPMVGAGRLDDAVPAGPLRAATVRVGRLFEQADASVRRWPAAGLAMLGLAAAFGWLLVAGAAR